jgi:hypothetical protein
MKEKLRTLLSDTSPQHYLLLEVIERFPAQTFEQPAAFIGENVLSFPLGTAK